MGEIKKGNEEISESIKDDELKELLKDDDLIKKYKEVLEQAKYSKYIENMCVEPENTKKPDTTMKK